jgi:hypothetical protein
MNKICDPNSQSSMLNHLHVNTVLNPHCCPVQWSISAHIAAEPPHDEGKEYPSNPRGLNEYKESTSGIVTSGSDPHGTHNADWDGGLRLEPDW